MENMVHLRAVINKDDVQIETTLHDTVTRQLVATRARLEEDAVKQWLVNQGWTPPKDNCTSEQSELLMYEFRNVIESDTDTLDWEISLLATLAAALMEKLPEATARQVMTKVLDDARAEGIFDHFED